MKRRCSAAISRHEAGIRLIDFLAGRFSYLGRESWTDEIAQARVLVNGRATDPVAVLMHGDTVEYLPAAFPEPQVEAAYDVLFEDEALLAVNKPGNLPCHPGGRYFRHTLWALIKRRVPEEGIFFVHRLDRETSGVVLMARHSRYASMLGRQMAGGNFRKRYTALVEGRFPAAPVTAEGVIAPDRASAVRKKMRFIPLGSPDPPPPDGKPCRTRFKSLVGGSGISLVSASPEGGRHHQIRATLLALGYPVVGDKVYGVDETLFIRFIEDRLTQQDRTRLRLDRQALHSAELEFDHPGTGRRIRIMAPIPPLFEKLLGRSS